MTRNLVYKAEVTSTDKRTSDKIQKPFKIYATKSISTEKKYPNMFGIRKRKSTTFDQMDHCQANTSGQKQKTKLHSVPRGKANDYKRSFIEHS